MPNRFDVQSVESAIREVKQISMSEKRIPLVDEITHMEAINKYCKLVHLGIIEDEIQKVRDASCRVVETIIGAERLPLRAMHNEMLRYDVTDAAADFRAKIGIAADHADENNISNFIERVLSGDRALCLSKIIESSEHWDLFDKLHADDLFQAAESNSMSWLSDIVSDVVDRHTSIENVDIGVRPKLKDLFSKLLELVQAGAVEPSGPEKLMNIALADDIVGFLTECRVSSET